MAHTQRAPYGCWASPITGDVIVSGTLRLGEVALNSGNAYWLEGRPAEAGRVVLMRQDASGTMQELTPAPFNVRTRAHEYGGGALAVQGETIVFSNFADNLLYQMDAGGAPRAITADSNCYYADMQFDTARERLIAVREDHRATGEAINTLVAVALGGGQDDVVLAEGHDFYSTPRISPDGTQIAFLGWDHPNLPWDGTTLYLAGFAADGSLTDVRAVLGGPDESIYQPEWSPDGVLHAVSDRTGWWNIYRYDGEQWRNLAPLDAEFGQPQWVFGMRSYGFTSPDDLLCVVIQDGSERLMHLDATSGTLTHLLPEYTSFDYVVVSDGQAVFQAASPTRPVAVMRLELASGAAQALRAGSSVQIDERYFSIPEQIAFETTGGQTAYAIYYAPKNPDFAAPDGELPPLLVRSHGGPTGAASTAFSLSIQYWTSRGFAFVDVNYGGSTGYGREYRQRLNGNWGIVDVDDCVNAAKSLAARGLADPDRLAIDGGSAGGYTTLSALTFRDTFKAGCSLFGISELEVFAKDTHKFESRYLDTLVGPYPERKDIYYERSPINYVDQLNCPMILIQGLDDKIVPPNQAEMMRDAVRHKELPVAYIAFEGEGHGFRKAANIKRALEAELYFFGRVFGFTPADTIEPVEIDNMD